MANTVDRERSSADRLAYVHAAAGTTVSANARRRAIVGTRISKRQSDRELNLARRAGFAGRKTGPRDSAEHRRADDVARRPEVGMVQHVEHIRSELKAGAPCVNVLDEREIDVAKARSDDDVSAQTAEPAGRDEW